MSFEITTTVTCYLLPGDHDAALATFLGHLKDKNEMWIIAYAFTLVPMIDEIIATSKGAGKVHIYLDHSESAGPAERPELQKLVEAGIEVTIGTSPVGPGYICHTKGIACDDSPQPWCWEGSVNFSQSGFYQVNTALFFGSSKYYAEFVNQFKALRNYAWTNERAYQLMKAPPAGVTIGKPSPNPVGNSIAIGEKMIFQTIRRQKQLPPKQINGRKKVVR